MSSFNTHIFFCNETDCSNMTTYYGATCYDCCAAMLGPEGCPGCGYVGATLVGQNGYCGGCWEQRYGCSSVSDAYDEYEGVSCRCRATGPMCDHCQDLLDADMPPVVHWCGKQECTQCQSEYYEQCGGCGVHCDLWNDRYCKSCYEDRYEPKVPALPPSPEPDYRDPADVRDEIEEITAKLRGTSMTPGQQADWQWLLRNRQEELARMEAEMWAGYDADDLRKMDQNMRML